jgi:hypothetical protein
MACPPNGLPLSCRERATPSLQKANDLAREAVSCNAVLDGNKYDVGALQYQDAVNDQS